MRFERAERLRIRSLILTVNRRKIMHGIFVLEVNHGEKGQEHESRMNPFLEELEREIAKLERISAEVTMRHAVVSHIRNDLLEMLGLNKEAKSEEDEPEKTQTQENTSKKEPPKYEETPEKIDVGPEESLSEPMSWRLKVLEQAVKDVVSKLGSADMTTRFKQIGEIYQQLEKCINCSEEQKGTVEHLAEVEAAVGEALHFLSTSKVETRFNLLKELRQELEKALANSHAMT
jgi:hypothetical protein